MDRYSVVTGKNPREMVLLRALPCKWGKCTFCDYIHDNCTDPAQAAAENRAVLSHVTGRLGVLDVIDSASCFDLPDETMRDLKAVVAAKHIHTLFTECHYMYKDRLPAWQGYFGVKTIFRCGVETFDHTFRNKILNKGAYFSSPAEVAQYFQSVCLMVGIAGQTKDMIRSDIQALLAYFPYGCINIFTPNSTPLQADEKLIAWFRDEFACLEQNPNIEILWRNTDLGVGD